MRYSTKTRLVAAALASTLLGASGSTPDGGRIVNGLNTQDFPTTGALLIGSSGNITANNAGSWCSGTLIGCQTFLTAAHCVDDTVASHYWVYLQHSGIHTVSSIDVYPGYTGSSGRDVAVVHLSSPVTGIEPTVFNETHDLDAMGVGLDGTIAGFGQTSGSGNDYGVKRYGDVVTADCDTGVTAGEGNDKLVCWDFENPVGPAGDDSNTCNGDSGGPLFMDFAGTIEVVGVTSAGSLESCLAGDHSWDASVYYNRTWIDGQLGADSVSTCGGIPPVGDVDVTVHKNSGSLSTVNPNDGFSVVLTGTPSLVRFTLNGTDNGSFDPDFYVKQGSGASTADFDCKADGNSVFGACEFASPAAGTWSIHVQRVSGGGEYQVTTTVFGGDPPVCGNDVQESGEECDGTDDGACPGLCTGGCACPAPVCGNNVQESGEECDGTDGGACPGQCNGSCACPAPVCGNNVQESGEECDGTDDGACPGECQGDCSCLEPCTTGPLYGLKLRSNEKRVVYKGWLFDDSGFYAALDPTAADFSLLVEDGGDSIDLAIPQAHAGWVKADPVRRKYVFKGDGSLGGLRRVVLSYRDRDVNSLWKILVRGKFVPGSASINEGNILDYTFNVDNTCHLETW